MFISFEEKNCHEIFRKSSNKRPVAYIIFGIRKEVLFRGMRLFLGGGGGEGNLDACVDSALSSATSHTHDPEYYRQYALKLRALSRSGQVWPN